MCKGGSGGGKLQRGGREYLDIASLVDALVEGVCASLKGLLAKIQCPFPR